MFSKDTEQIERWLVLAKSGDADAQASLGWEYEDSDPKEALRWYRRAAEQGHADAQFALGLMYYEGRGVQENHAEAAIWLHQAVENGSTIALYNLAFQYQYGEGVPKDLTKAEELYVAYISRDGDIDSGFVESQLGKLYRDVDNPDRDVSKAHSYFLSASEYGSVESMVALGDIYREGCSDIPRDFNESISWYRKAADKGSREAQFKLAEMYERGLGVSENDV